MTRSVAAAAALLLVFSLSACGDDDEAAQGTAADTSTSGMPGMSGMGAMDMSKVGDGMKATVHGYTLAGVTAPSKAGKAGQLKFRIDGPNGVQKDFTRQMTELMHVYVVREDLTQYQHVHPAINPTSGVWSVDFTVPEPGPYRVVTEFEALTPEGTFDDRILGAGFTVAGKYKPSTAEPAAIGTAEADGYRLTLDGEPKVTGGELKLTITKDGVDVTDLEPYLASFAHITGFREGNLATVHAHPQEAPAPEDTAAAGGPVLTVTPMFGEAGHYRLFVQFKTAGVIHLAPLDVMVA